MLLVYSQSLALAAQKTLRMLHQTARNAVHVRKHPVNRALDVDVVANQSAAKIIMNSEFRTPNSEFL